MTGFKFGNKSTTFKYESRLFIISINMYNNMYIYFNNIKIKNI